MRPLSFALLLPLLLAPSAAGAQEPGCAPGTPRRLLPGADAPLPAYAEIHEVTSPGGTARLRLAVARSGEVGSVCVVAADAEWISEAARRAVGRWRFRADARGGVVDVEVRFSPADTMRRIPGREPLLRDAPPVRWEGGVLRVTVPVGSVRHGAGPLRPTSALTPAARDSAELALLLALVPPQPPANATVCVDAPGGSWVFRQLARERPGARSADACGRLRDGQVGFRLDWNGPGTGVTADGVVLVRGHRSIANYAHCPPGSGLCGSGHSSEYECAAAFDGTRWVAECRSTGRVAHWVS